MLSNLRLGFIGWGKMCEAMIRGLIEQGAAVPQQIIATGRSLENGRGLELHEKYAIRTSTDNLGAANVDVLTLSVKPADMHEVLSQLKGCVPQTTTVLSIAAGVSIETLSSLNVPNLARAMPNTPGCINRGVTVWTSASGFNSDHRERIAGLLRAMGEEIYVEKELYVDMATAVSGSGPGIVSYFTEAFVDAGVRIGLPRHLAQKLVILTLRGTAEYAIEAKAHLAQLCDDVTSPAGTTAEALYRLDKAGLRAAFADAVMAAFERSRELGKK